MRSDTHIDYAEFQLSPKRSRCELFVSSNGNKEKLASGLVKPFVTHLKVAEEQVALSLQLIKLEVENCKDAETWFTKGTLESFVRFVSTPEVLELVNTFDAEVSQLESARRIYAKGVGDQPSAASGGVAAGMMAAADATKKELLRAIDVRLSAVQQDLATAFARASSVGFNPDTVSELKQFADCFGAHRLNEACTKFISLCQRRPELIRRRKPDLDDQVVRGSRGSDLSINDPNGDQVGCHVNSKPHQPSQNKHQEQLQPNTVQTRHHIDQSKPATSQQSKFSSTTQQSSQNESKEEEKKEEVMADTSPGEISRPTRRLSVQDRISLFENRQKESSSSGGKPIAVAKSIELRRLSSDVSTAPAVVERAVLRRWSGATDTSIDLCNDKQDGNMDSSEDKERKDEKGLTDKVNSVKVERKNVPGRAADSGWKDQGKNQEQGANLLGKEEDAGLRGWTNLKDQLGSQNSHYQSFSGKSEQAESGDQGVSQEKVKGSLTREKGGSEVQSRGLADAVGDAAHEGELKKRVEAQGKDQPMSQSRFRAQSHSRTFSGQFETGTGIKLKDARCKGSEGDQFAPQPLWRSFSGEIEEVKKDLASSQKQMSKVEDSGVREMKFKKQIPLGSEQSKKTQVRRDEGGSVVANNKVVHGKTIRQSEESLSAPMVSVDQTQRIRQSKGNQELNDELKMKANELEKLFTEHKLRVPADQFSSSRRSKPADVQIEREPSSQYKKPDAASVSPDQMPDGNLITESIDDRDYADSLRRSFSGFSYSEDSRGKFYEKYMQKRDAKLREEWGSTRAEKEARLMAMKDILEQSRAEMKAKFSGSVDGLDSISSARRRAEKVRSFNFRSQREQHPINSVQIEDDLSKFPDLRYHEEDRSYNDASLVNGSSRSSNNKKHFPNRNVSLSAPYTTAAAVPVLSSQGFYPQFRKAESAI